MRRREKRPLEVASDVAYRLRRSAGQEWGARTEGGLQLGFPLSTTRPRCQGRESLCPLPPRMRPADALGFCVAWQCQEPFLCSNSYLPVRSVTLSKNTFNVRLMHSTSETCAPNLIHGGLAEPPSHGWIGYRYATQNPAAETQNPAFLPAARPACAAVRWKQRACNQLSALWRLVCDSGLLHIIIAVAILRCLSSKLIHYVPSRLH